MTAISKPNRESVAVLSAAGPDKGSFTSGVWHGKANYDGDGKFSDCAMTAQSKSGVLLGFVIARVYPPKLLDRVRE